MLAEEREILKGSSRHLRQGAEPSAVAIHRFVEEEKAVHSVGILCRMPKVSRSGFYAWSKRGSSQRTVADDALLKEIVEIHKASRETCGVPRIYAALRRDRGVRCAKRGGARPMREAGVRNVDRHRPQGTTRRDPQDPLAPDLIQGQFTADAPNHLWVAGITQHPTGGGWLHTAAVVDLFPRKVIGWAMSEQPRTQIVLDALNMTVWGRRQLPGDTIHHSDLGTQYTTMAYGLRLKATGLVGSMSSVGDACDNGHGELPGPDPAHRESPAFGDLRVHRGILPSLPRSLVPRLPVPKRVRKKVGSHSYARPTPGFVATSVACPPNRGNTSPRRRQGRVLTTATGGSVPDRLPWVDSLCAPSVVLILGRRIVVVTRYAPAGDGVHSCPIGADDSWCTADAVPRVGPDGTGGLVFCPAHCMRNASREAVRWRVPCS